MKKYGVVALVTTAAVATSVAPASLQSQQQMPGAIRSRITMVPVDVRVTDRDGVPITGLKEEDFTVLEDGVPQKLGHFEFRELKAEAPGPARPALRKPLDKTVDDPSHRTFLIVFGRGRLHNWAGGYTAAIQFVREQLLPQDKVAIAAWNRATDFTTDHARIATMLEKLRDKHNGIDLRMQFRDSGLEARFGSKELPPRLQKEVDAVFDDPALSPRQLASVRIRDQKGYEDAMRQQFDAHMDRMMGESGRGFGDPRFEEFFSAASLGQSTLMMLYSSVEYLKYFDGEKHLVLINDGGIYLPRAEDDEGLAATASDGRVAIHTILTGGPPIIHTDGNNAEFGGYGVSPVGGARLSPVSQAMIAGGPQGPGAGLFAIGTMRTFATRSGGYFSITKRAAETFERIDANTRAQYVLGYYPATAATDGRYRKIEVRVNRPGATVSSRRGYFATEQLMPFDRRQFLTHARITSAGMSTQHMPDVAMSIKTRVEGSELIVEGTAGAPGTELDLAIFVGNTAHDIVGEKWGRVAGGTPFLVRVPVKADPRYVKAIAYDYAKDLVGTATSRLR